MKNSLQVGIFSLAVLAAAGAANAQSGSDVGWPTYNNEITGERYSALDQITTENVKDLKPLCKIKVGAPGSFQTSPIVVDGVLYLTTAMTTMAIDPVTCEMKWRNIYTPEEKIVYAVNRGAAYMDGMLYRGTPDGRLMAISAKDGVTQWIQRVSDPTVGEFLSSAPVAWNGMVFTGPAGSDWGIRGHVMGFDAKSGEELWRFWTIPKGDEPGAETWHIPDSAKRGGGGMWTTYTLDPKTGELFVPVANPSPDFAPQYRPGDNLYTNSVIALDAKTGKLNWYYQFTPADGFDYDQGAAPTLFNDAKGEARVAAGSKDGHLYILDRKSHKLLHKVPVTTIVKPAHPATEGPVFACPGALGGVEWNGPAYSPQTNALYVGAVDWCMTFKTSKEQPAYDPGRTYYGTNARPPADQPANGWVSAVDAESGDYLWRFKTPKPVVSGITPTAGGLVFAGDLGGNFYAFDAKKGSVLMHQNIGGGLAGGIVTYTIDGKQYVAATSGNISRATFGAFGHPTLVVFSTDAKGDPKVVDAVPGAPKIADQGSPDPDDDDEKKASSAPAATGGSDDKSKSTTTAATSANASGGHDLKKGAQIFTNYCAACHGAHGEGGVGPSLVDLQKRKPLPQAIEWIEHPKSPMPSLYPKPLSLQDVKDVGAYIEEAFRKN